MSKKLKIIILINILILFVSLLILRYSELVRGQNPLYASLKMIGWGLLFLSIVCSATTTLYIFFESKKTWSNNIHWLLLSALPILYVSGIFYWR